MSCLAPVFHQDSLRSVDVTMPYHDEEHPGQPLWQSVLLFCCKGMIEGIMVVLFFWLLVQVLFTKQLAVHLQVLLLVGLIVFCLCLVLGCVLCWRSTRAPPPRAKDPAVSARPPEEPRARPQAPPPASPSSVAGPPYEELGGDNLGYPSTLSSSAPSEDVFASLTSSPGGTLSTSGHGERGGKSFFSLRRLSTPQISAPPYQPVDRGRASMSSFPILGLLSKTRRVLDRRCSVSGDRVSYSERLRLTGPGASPPPSDIPLAPLHYGSGRITRPAAVAAGSSSSSGPWIRFTAAFSPGRGTLTVTILSLTGAAHRLEEVWARGSLLRVPGEDSGQAGLDPRPQGLVLELPVGSVEELRRSVLTLSLHARLPPLDAESSLLGELEVHCADKEWGTDRPLDFTKELSAKGNARKMSASSLDARSSRSELSRSPKILAQLFILLQYQTLAHRVKAMVLKVEQLDSLSRWPAAAGYQMVTKLHHEGVLISTQSTVGWNSPFLFDLPPGDLSLMQITLELIIMQNQSTVLGRVLIGSEAPEAGRAHWREMCSQGPVERAQWHHVEPEPL